MISGCVQVLVAFSLLGLSICLLAHSCAGAGDRLRRVWELCAGGIALGCAVAMLLAAVLRGRRPTRKERDDHAPSDTGAQSPAGMIERTQMGQPDAAAMAALRKEKEGGILAERQFVCGACGGHAGSVMLLAEAIISESFVCLRERAIGAGDAGDLRQIVDTGDLRALHEFDKECAPSYCPECDACYCGEHWERWDEYEDGGWYDCTMGRCPRGHARMLDD